MLGKFLDSITFPQLTIMTFEFVWEEYSDGGISGIADLGTWEANIGEVLCALVSRLPNRRGGSALLDVVY